MNKDVKSTLSRRELLGSGAISAGSALTALSAPAVHAGGRDLIQLAIVGCGGRGTGAVLNALGTRGGPIKLIAMADAYADRLSSCVQNLAKPAGAGMEVPPDRKFVGFDAYRSAMDQLRPGDIVILTTPPAFRWVHFQYAIRKRLNVFMEKPVTVDGPSSKRMMALADQAEALGLKVGVGLMARHAENLQQLEQRIRGGDLGEILFLRGYRMHEPVGYFESPPKPANVSDLEYQVRRFHSFLWASGGCYSDFYIHIIDHLCWMKGDWPVSAQALGGREYKTAPDGSPWVDQNFDTYSVEYTFKDGARLFFDGRCVSGAATFYSSYVHGSKGIAVASSSGDCGAPSAIYRGQTTQGVQPVWQSSSSSDPYENEWQALVDAVRNNRRYSEVKRGITASLVTSMGRMAAHTGQVITLDQMLNCPHEMAPGLDRLTASSPAPLQPGPDGRYPVPKPGIVTTREY